MTTDDFPTKGIGRAPHHHAEGFYGKVVRVVRVVRGFVFAASLHIGGGAVTAPALTAADVRAGVTHELRHLAGLGVTGPEAEQRALAITWAKIGNSPALAERQVNTSRCHCCGEPLTDAAPVIAVLNPGGGALHMHHSCHEQHRARRRALIDRIMAAAGYGADHRTGDAA